MENEEEDNSEEDDERTHHNEDEEESDEDEEEIDDRRVRFDVPLKKQLRKSNEAISDEDIMSESEDGSEVSQRENRNITSNPNTPSKQRSENLEFTEDMSSTLKKKREEDLEKGQAVKRQLVCPFLHDSVCAG
jgi:protein AATF/BFR2